jgi:small-conductance mechanosensitive channel
VVLDSGEAGTVLDVTIRSTRLLTRDNVVVTVPNSVLNAARITNHSDPHPKTRVKVPVGAAYGSDAEAVESLLLDAAAAVELVADAPEPRARFRGFGDSALEYELLCWVPSPLMDARAAHELNHEIYRRFTDAGVEIPFPQRELHLRSDGVAETGLAVGTEPATDAGNADPEAR